MSEKESVAHPDHYNKGIEVIKFIESWDLNFSRGSAVKYICRGGLKDPEKEIEDLEKARQYLEFEIQRIKRVTPPTACPHCAFIETLGDVQSNREYWIITEIFVYLHGGKDYCTWKEDRQ